MTMKTRFDGSRYPDSDEEGRVLADFTDPDAETGPGFGYQRALGDLIVDVLVGRDLIGDAPTGSHFDWESFEAAMLKRVGLEIRAVNHALATGGGLTTDDHPGDTFTTEHACEFLRGLARRAEAGAELAVRLRNARWGHPNFGGGEAFLAKQAEKLRNGRHS